MMLDLHQVTVTGRLHDINCSFASGQMYHLLGENGAGKSSLLHVMAGLLPAEQGQVTLTGQSLSELALNHLARVRCFQTQGQGTPFELSVAETLQFFVESRDIPPALEQALEVGDLLTRRLNQLSGGEARRVHIARALLQIWPALQSGEGIVLLDEPIQGLDVRHQHLLFRLLRTFATSGNLVVVTHHDFNHCATYADRVLLLRKGHLAAHGSVDEVMTKSVIEEVFDCRVNVILQPHQRPLFQTFLD